MDLAYQMVIMMSGMSRITHRQVLHMPQGRDNYWEE